MKDLTQQVPDEWLKLAPVQAALGGAYGALGMLTEAIDHCEAALQAEEGDCPISVVSNLNDFKTLQAVQVWKEIEASESAGNAHAQSPSAEERIKQAITQLGRLCAVTGKTEWLTIRARSFQRLALISSGDSRRDSLQQMVLFYGEASESARVRDGDNAAARLLDWLGARIVVGWQNSTEDTQFRERTLGQLEEIEVAASKQGAPGPSRESLLLAPKCLLIRHLVQWTLPRASTTP